jgi:hypothetical protein
MDYVRLVEGRRRGRGRGREEEGERKREREEERERERGVGSRAYVVGKKTALQVSAYIVAG